MYVICKNKLHVCKILFINKMISDQCFVIVLTVLKGSLHSDQCFVIVLTVLKGSLHIYPGTFKERQDIVFTLVPSSVCHTFIVT